LGLTIKSDQAQVIGMHGRPIQISGLEVYAPDLDLNPNVSVRLNSTGLAQDYLAMLNRTPIQHDLGKQLETLEVNGQASMPLSVDFDLERQRVVLINGQFKLSDVAIALKKEGVPIEKINGVFEFNDEVVIVKEIRGEALGGPVTLSGEWGPKLRQLALKGELSSIASEKHQKLSAPAIKQILKGQRQEVSISKCAQASKVSQSNCPHPLESLRLKRDHCPFDFRVFSKGKSTKQP
jgi:uncharacterized protein YhdP